MMVFPRNDYALAKYLIDANRAGAQVTKICYTQIIIFQELRRVMDIGAILESCNFSLFWRLIRGEFKQSSEPSEEKYRNLSDIKRIIEPITGFEDAARIYACRVVNITFQRIEKPMLVRLLGGVSGEYEHILA